MSTINLRAYDSLVLKYFKVCVNTPFSDAAHIQCMVLEEITRALFGQD